MCVRVSIVVFAIFAHSASAQEKKNDQQNLQGTWTGQHVKQAVKLIFKGDTFVLEKNGNLLEGDFKIDASKLPKQIDLSFTGGTNNEAKSLAGLKSEGIYELIGDQFKWIIVTPGAGKRPSAFPQEGGSEHFYLKLERQKK